MAYKNIFESVTERGNYEAWKQKNQKVLDSKDQYFLITKDPIQMKKILVDDGFVPSDVKKVIVGPCNDRPGATKLGNNQSITQEEAEAATPVSACGSTLSVIPTIKVITSLGVANFINFVKGQPLKKMILIDAFDFEVTAD